MFVSKRLSATELCKEAGAEETKEPWGQTIPEIDGLEEGGEGISYV